MGSAPASLADNPFLITLLLEMQTTIFLRTEMSRKTEYVHNPCFLSANILKILGVFAENQKDINRIKVVLVEKKRTNKWLAEQLGKDPATVSKWCTNTSQPGLETLLEIARVLEVDVKELLNSSLEGGIQMVRLVK